MVNKRENIKRHLEKSEAARKRNRLDMAKAMCDRNREESGQVMHVHMYEYIRMMNRLEGGESQEISMAFEMYNKYL